ncbi:MAG: molecular chaperone [Chlorobiaceae bacterium]
MNRVFKHTLILLQALLISTRLHAETAPAQIAISPAMFELKIGSKPVYDSVRLKNLKKEPVTLKVEVYNWTLDEENKLQLLPPDPQSIDQWMMINPVNFTIEPGKEQVIRFSIRPRSTPSPGEHRAIIYFSEQPRQSEGDGVEMLFKIGVGIYGYADEIRHAGTLQRLQLDKASSTLHAEIQNNGNVHARLKGSYAIWKKGSFPGFKSMGSYTNWPPDKPKPEGFIASGDLNNTPVLAGKKRTIVTRLPLPNDKTGYMVTVSGTIDDAKVEKILQ